jgi:hypothetical protein
MSSLLDGLTQQLGSADYVNKLSAMLGTDNAQTHTAVQTAIPTILAGLAKNSRTPEGARELHTALATQHDGSVLDEGPDALQAAQGMQGDKILGHVFGSNLNAVQSQLGATSGVGSSNAASLLQTLAPLVMGYLGKQQRAGGLDPGGLSSMLGSSGAAAALPGPLGSLLGDGTPNRLMSAMSKLFRRG